MVPAALDEPRYARATAGTFYEGNTIFDFD
jgi:hypothetical protein